MTHLSAITTRSCFFLLLLNVAVIAFSLFAKNENGILLCNGFETPSLVSRRQAMITGIGSIVTIPTIGIAAADDGTGTVQKEGSNKNQFQYEFRNRGSNDNAVIREDYYYMMGKTPPRLLNGPLRMDDPQWNAFGSCQTTEDGSASNSCTYVSLKQRIPAYSKYGYSIGYGAREYTMLGKVLHDAARTNSESSWTAAASYVTTLPSTSPPPAIDALLKMVLFASLMLTSPNYSGPSRELLVARFYVNEVSYATREIEAAIQARDGERAVAAWEFGKDSWNSYFQVVNQKITSKVGDPFPEIV